MRTRIFSLFVIAALGGIGIASAHADPQAEPKAGPPSHDDDAQVLVTSGKGRLGVAALQISAELRSHLGAPSDRGVLIDAVRPDSPAARAGLRVGDIVTEVDGAPARSASDMLAAMADRKAGDTVTVVAIRNRQRVELHARLDTDPGPARQSKRMQSFDRIPDDMNGWFRFDGNAQDMQRAIDELRQRMEQLEHRLDQRGNRPHSVEKTGGMQQL